VFFDNPDGESFVPVLPNQFFTPSGAKKVLFPYICLLLFCLRKTKKKERVEIFNFCFFLRVFELALCVVIQPERQQIDDVVLARYIFNQILLLLMFCFYKHPIQFTGEAKEIVAQKAQSTDPFDPFAQATSSPQPDTQPQQQQQQQQQQQKKPMVDLLSFDDPPMVRLFF
jgi:hypothetical protein